MLETMNNWGLNPFSVSELVRNSGAAAA